MIADASELAQTYVSTYLEWSQLSGNPRKANRLADRGHALAMQLKSSEEGRQHLVALAKHEDTAVRLWAAGDCLTIDADLGLKVLDGIDRDGDRYSFDARVTAREWRAGRLNPDW